MQFDLRHPFVHHFNCSLQQQYAFSDSGELIKMSLPNDSQGNICGYDAAHNHTILYYPSINDPVVLDLFSSKESV